MTLHPVCFSVFFELFLRFPHLNTHKPCNTLYFIFHFILKCSHSCDLKVRGWRHMLWLSIRSKFSNWETKKHRIAMKINSHINIKPWACTVHQSLQTFPFQCQNTNKHSWTRIKDINRIFLFFNMFFFGPSDLFLSCFFHCLFPVYSSIYDTALDIAALQGCCRALD